MGPKTFNEIVDRVYPTRKLYNKEGKDLQWDFPDYGGLPKRIINQLSSEAVDAMQSVISQKFVSKKDFAREYRFALRGLGEPGKY